MATITTEKKSHQMFSQTTGTNTISFARAVNTVFLTITGTVNVSFDGGAKFMVVAAGTHQFYNVYLKELWFTGAGTYEGCGVCN